MLLLLPIFALLVSASPLNPNSTWALLAWSQGKDTINGADMVDIDLFDQNSMIPDLHKAGKVVICYYSAGTAEAWRPDVKANPKAWEAIAVGKISGWDELWLDITQFDALTALMQHRLDLAASYGCDGIEPDNTDCAFNPTDCWKKIKPAINQQQATAAQTKYNLWTANYAHSKGMIAGLKNTGDLVATLHSSFDFSIVEQCLEYKECPVYAPFHQDKKPIFGIEYKQLSSSDCSTAAKSSVRMKYCAGKDDQECANGSSIHNCY